MNNSDFRFIIDNLKTKWYGKRLVFGSYHEGPRTGYGDSGAYHDDLYIKIDDKDERLKIRRSVSYNPYSFSEHFSLLKGEDTVFSSDPNKSSGFTERFDWYMAGRNFRNDDIIEVDAVVSLSNNSYDYKLKLFEFDIADDYDKISDLFDKLSLASAVKSLVGKKVLITFKKGKVNE